MTRASPNVAPKWKPALLLSVALLLPILFLALNPLLDEAYFGKLWSDTDISWQSYPNKALLVRSLKQGRLPLWNRHIYAGMPFAANPQAQVFYPPSLLFLFGIRHAFGVSLVLHFGLAFVGTWLLALHLLRDLPAPRTGAAYAACAFSFSGSMSTQIQQTAIFDTASWIPLFLYGILARRPAIAACATAFLLLSGHSQMASFAFLLAVVAGTLDVYRGWRRRVHTSGLLRLGAGIFLGVGLAGILWLPAAELLEISMRGGGVTEAFAAVNAFQSWHFPLVFNPAAFAAFGGDTYWTYPYVGAATLLLFAVALVPIPGPWIRLRRLLFAVAVVSVTFRPLLGLFIGLTKGFRSFATFYLSHWNLLAAISAGWPYAAVVVPMALLFGCYLLAPNRAFLFGILTFFCLGLTMGPRSPFFHFLYKLPILAEGRGAVRWFHLYALAASITAAFAVARIRLAGKKALLVPLIYLGLRLLFPWHRHLLTAPFIFSALGVGCYLLLARGAAERSGASSPGALPPDGLRPPGASESHSQETTSLEDKPSIERTKLLARFVPHALVLVELFTFGTSIDRVTSPNLYRYADIDRLIPDRAPDARILVLGGSKTELSQNAGMVRGYDAALGYEPLALRSAMRLVARAKPLAIFEGGKLQELRELKEVAVPSLLSAGALPILRLLRARYIISQGSDPTAPITARLLKLVGNEPARRIIRLADRTESCHLIVKSAGYELGDATGAVRIPIVYGPDPDLVKGGFAGADLTITAERSGIPAMKRKLHVSPEFAFHETVLAMPEGGPDVRLKLEVSRPGAISGGLNWIMVRIPSAEIDNPERARLLGKNLRRLRIQRAPDGTVRWIDELTGTLPLASAPKEVSRDLSIIGRETFDPANTLVLPGWRGKTQLPACRIRSAASADDGTVRIAYEADAPTELLITNAYVPGLRGTVDGTAVKLRRANLHFIAAAVPGGRHQLEIRYRPFSFVLGSFITMLSLLASSLAFSSCRKESATATD